jgi:hypothetical protein
MSLWNLAPVDPQERILEPADGIRGGGFSE